MASLGGAADQAELTQKHAEVQDLTTRQQNAERQQDKILLKIQQVGESKPPARQDLSANATSTP